FLNLYWPLNLFIAAAALITIYTDCIYPHIPFRLSGGEANAALIWIRAEGTSSHAVDCKLLDENDQGYYVPLPDTSKAPFIPQDRVQAIQFSDSGGDLKEIGRASCR